MLVFNSIYFGKSCTVYSMYDTHFEFRVSLKSRDEAIRGCILVERSQNLKRHYYFCNFLRIYSTFNTDLKHRSNPTDRIG